jgi:hypothetical protein
MRFLVTWCGVLFLAGTAVAVDYDKIERRLTKEPTYQTKTPRYALLLFGAEPRLRVWAVLDGETLYLDRNGDGDLTAANERFAKEADCKSLELKDPDGKTTYIIDRIRTDFSFYTPKVRAEREKKGTPPGLMAYVTIKGTVQYEQYCDIVELRDSPKTALLAHFHGPLTIAPMTINWKLPDNVFLRKGKEPPEFIANIGTMNEKHGCWVVVRTCDEKKCLFPEAVRPVVEVEYPAVDEKSPRVKKTYTLSGYRCGAAFRSNLQVPDEVGSGKAKIRLSFDAWKEGQVKASEVEFSVREEVDKERK